MTAWALILVVVAGSPSDPPPPLDAPASSVPDTPIPAPDPILETRSTPFEVGAWQALAGGTACFLLACPGAPLTLGLSVLAAPAVVGWMTTRMVPT